MAELDQIRMPGAEDATVEAAVLRHLLAVHPVQLTLAETVREIAGDDADFSQGDAVERAVRKLCAVGLAHRNGEMLVPSRAALCLDELFE